MSSRLAKSAAIVAFGDSITDGATSTPNTNSSWPSQLAVRLAANKATANLAIVNEGISGNRLLNDGAGVSALARFDRDVLSQPGVKWLIVLEGINDIGLGNLPGAPPAEAPTVDDLIAAHKQIIERAHMHGIKVIGATLTPYVGAAYATDRGEAMREAANSWIRTSKAYDAVIDFDAVVRIPPIRTRFARHLTSATTCTPTTKATKPWPPPSIWDCSQPSKRQSPIARAMWSGWLATAVCGRGSPHPLPAQGVLRRAIRRADARQCSLATRRPFASALGACGVRELALAVCAEWAPSSTVSRAWEIRRSPRPLPKSR